MPLVTSPSDIRGFSQANQPAVVPEGGLWYDTSVDTLYVSDGSTFNTIGASSFAGAAVVSQSTTIGDYTTPTSAVSSSDNPSGGTFIEDYTTNTGWTQTGTGATVDSGVADEFACVNVDLSTNNRVSKAIGATLSNSAWLSTFDFLLSSMATARSSVLISFTDTTGTIGSSDGIGVLFADTAGTKGVMFRSNNNGGIDSTGSQINLSLAIRYYATLERLSTTSVTLKIFSDSARTIQVGSTSTNTISSSIIGLTTVQHGSFTAGNFPETASYRLDTLRINATVSSSPTSLFDNDTATRWTSNSEINPNCYVDQGSSLNFAGAAFFYDNTNTTATSMLIQTSSDGVTFTTKRTITTSNLVSGYNFYRFNIATGVRYVRFYGNDSGAKILSLYEVKIYQRTEAQIINDLGILEIDSTDSTLNAAGT